MYFVILAADRPDMLEQRLAHRPAHLDYWASLPGVVKVAGAMLDDPAGDPRPKGSCFVIEADSVEAARAMVAKDPFAQRGIFGDDIRIEAIRPAIGEWFAS